MDTPEHRAERYRPWRQRLARISEAGQRRVLRTLEPTGPVTGQLDGRPVLVACSNDYLGLAWDPEVRAAAHGGGSASSRLISGTRPVHTALEEALGDWLGRPALLFGSGYQANLAVFSTLCEKTDTIASDAANHASMIDGLRLGRAQRVVTPHCDPDAIPANVRMIALEGLYSMDGDIPPFTRYPEPPWLAVDEAHAIGCLGPDGRGAAAAAGIEPDVLIGTFGKAFGAAGAFVSGPPEMIDLLINKGRSFIFTTAMPEPVAAMALAGLQRARPELRDRLAHNARRLRSGLTTLGWRPLGEAHIVPVVVGARAMTIAQSLLEQGIWAAGIRYPTVPLHQERIRFTVSAAHSDTDIDRILDAMSCHEPT